jgi:putative transposase
MPRRAQLGDAVCFHVINRGHDREVIFHDGVDHQAFLALLRRYRARFGFRLYHYCLMSTQRTIEHVRGDDAAPDTAARG